MSPGPVRSPKRGMRSTPDALQWPVTSWSSTSRTSPTRKPYVCSVRCSTASMTLPAPVRPGSGPRRAARSSTRPSPRGAPPMTMTSRRCGVRCPTRCATSHGRQGWRHCGRRRSPGRSALSHPGQNLRLPKKASRRPPSPWSSMTEPTRVRVRRHRRGRARQRVRVRRCRRVRVRRVRARQRVRVRRRRRVRARQRRRVRAHRVRVHPGGVHPGVVHPRSAMRLRPPR